MPASKIIPRDDEGKAMLFEHMAETLPPIAKILGISDAKIAAHCADTLALRHVVDLVQKSQDDLHKTVALKNLLRDGGPGDTNWLPSSTSALKAPAAVEAGIMPRFLLLAAEIKLSKNYTPAYGQALWLIGSSYNVDPDTWQPMLHLKLKSGQPVIGWTKGEASALEIMADRNDGRGFVFFTISTHPGTVDSNPLPTSMSTWKYKAIYRLHDQQVGQWSEVSNIVAGGRPIYKQAQVKKPVLRVERPSQ